MNKLVYLNNLIVYLQYIKQLKTKIMTTLVNLKNKNTNELISQNEFNSKKEAMIFIKKITLKEDQVIYGNFKSNGKNFYFKFN